jgi:hypothetical protein
MEYRSEMIARTAVRDHGLPQPVVQFLLSLRAPVPSKNDALVGHLVELIKSSKTHETSRSLYRDADCAAGIAQILRWISESQSEIGESICMRLILKSLMPMYLAAGHGKSGSSLIESISLLRMYCTLIELDRLTNNHDLAEWIRLSQTEHDPYDMIRKSFRVHLGTMTEVFWSELSNQQSATRPTKAVIGVPLPSEKHLDAWWSLACQFCDQRSQITVPANLGIGLVDWKKLREHWDKIAAIIQSCESANATENSDLVSKAEGSNPACAFEPKTAKLNDRRFIEIRSVKDPQLSGNLDALLRDARNEQGLLSLIVVKKLGMPSDASQAALLQNWQSDFIALIDSNAEASNVRGFVSDEGELTLVYHDIERSALARWIREAFAKLGTLKAANSLSANAPVPLVAGIASVNAPSRSFTIDQLIQSAWRCLDGASTQGAGAVKTIEVY